MENAEAHICIVSDRLLPNLIPVLMEKPVRVFLIASNSMMANGIALRFEKILLEQGFKASLSSGLPSSDLKLITEFLFEWLISVQEQYPNLNLVLNVTGGNKLMTIGLLQAMTGDVERIIYTDTQRNVLEQLPQGIEGAAHTMPLQPVLDAPLYLAAQGMILRSSLSDDSGWRQRAEQRKALTKYLGKQSGNLGNFIGQLNYLCNLALDKKGQLLQKPLQRLNRSPKGMWRDALQKISETDVLQWDGDRTLDFSDAESTRYLGGGWLEEFAWHQAKDLQPDDLRMSAVGTWEGTLWGRNELDVVVVHNNRLLLIECKTLKIGRDSHNDDQMLYKLDSVGDDVKGLFGDVILLTARMPTQAVKDRAYHHKIRIVVAQRFPRLQKDLRQWMQTGQFPTA